MTKNEFISAIAKYVRKYAPKYGICVHSPIIAQAILESNWGLSKLGAKYHNYFGLKCGSNWTGKSVNLATKEEYTAGTYTDIKANFRVFDSMEEGVKGYFDFISKPRYANLQGVTDPQTYLERIKADGYATSSKYVDNNMRIVTQYNLTKYDKEESTVQKTRQAAVSLIQSWVGKKESDGSHKSIIDIYNSFKPLPRGYKVKYTDAWCAATVSAVAIKLGYTDIMPVECSCVQLINQAKEMVIWQENDAYTPQPGDLVLYDWQDSGSGDNTGTPDHVGMVEEVSGSTIKVIEGNYSDAVKRRSIQLNGKYIRGYICPKYDDAAATTTKTGAPSKTVQWVGVVTSVGLNVRTWAGVENPNIKSYPELKKGDEVEVCDIVDASTGTPWYYVRIDGKVYGFVSSKYIAQK